MNKKRIVCYGDSNTWGYVAETDGRLEDDDRWAQVLAGTLGDGCTVVEEGLCGRTTVFDDPLNEGLNGMAHLYTCLMSHSLIDLLILMLGTNDTKERFSATPKNIADGIVRLVEKARTAPVWRGGDKPILVIAPVIIGEGCRQSSVAGEMGWTCVEKSRELPALFERCAALNDCAFLDCNAFCTVNPIDFMHLDRDSHRRLGRAVAEKVLTLI